MRPAPQRPPLAATNSAATATIDALSARIAALEQTLLQHAQQNQQLQDAGQTTSNSNTSSESGSGSTPGSPNTNAEISAPAAPSEDGPRSLIDYNVQLAAVALAQLSLAPRTEYVGNGTVLCAIHKVGYYTVRPFKPHRLISLLQLGDPESYRFPHPQTSLTSQVVHPSATETLEHRIRTWDILHEGMSGIENCLSSNGSSMTPIRRLVSKLPPRHRLEELVTSFFAGRNWQFGISEGWFRSACKAMWDHLDLRCEPSCRSKNGCRACLEEINPHWLSLLFSVLALTPGTQDSSQNCAGYFMHALAARRFTEDILLASPVYSTSEGSVNGGVLSCIAAVFLAMYLVDRGRVSEGWKLVGG